MSTPSPDTVPHNTVPHNTVPENSLPTNAVPRETVPHDRAASPAGFSRRGPALVAAGVACAVAVGYAGHQFWPATSHPAPRVGVAVSTAQVVRTDLSARQEVTGTLGYQGQFGVVNQLGPGVLSALPSLGDVIRRGQQLFAVTGQPVTLLYGGIPAWRTFAAGMSPGQDVRELQRNLADLGFDPGQADGTFGWSTEMAVDQWQRALGVTVTGTIPLGTVSFLPGPLRVTATPQALGALVAPGASVVSGTSTIPAVQVSLPVGGPAVRAGDQVLVTLPDGTTTVRGTVSTVGRVASVPTSGAGGTSGSTTSDSAPSAGAAGGGQPAIDASITIATGIPAGLDQAPVEVAITQQRAEAVLAVPVTALLAQPDGGYAVQVAGAHGRLIPVATGLFDGTSDLVAVSGPGLSAGLTVTVARG